MTETKRLEEIFSQAMQLVDIEERRKFVEQACEGDVELTQHVSALLKAAQEAGSFLESPVRMTEPARETEFPFLTAPLVAGDMGSLGPYRIVQPVGRGGMGIVFRAIDPKLQRVVAVKVLAPEIAINPTARLRFEREARSAAAVSHPHVVVIHAVDEAHNPPYLVMEFVQGKTLADKLAERGVLSIKEILRIGAQIAEGLAAAHQQGLVHRDVKPANVLLENGVERVKVTDFGLAKTVDDVAITRTGDLSGTPQFMSPEQASGGPLDHRTDLFSLGAVLYAMCTGTAPFRAEKPLALLKRICEDVPRPIRQANPDVPDWLCAIVDRLLAKTPADRFQTAAEVAALLQKHLATLQGGHIARPEPETPLRSALKLRRLWPWPILAFGLLVGIGVLVWLAWNRTQRNLGDRLPEIGEEPSVLLPGGAANTKKPGIASLARTPDPFDGKKAGDHRDDNALKLKLCWCPTGTTPGFWIGKYEVTQSEWAGLMDSMPSHALDKGKGDRYPIYWVSNADATEFCRKLTDQERKAGRLPKGWAYRLPSEAQWEFACRAGTTTETAFGDQLDSTQANFGGDWPHNGAPKGPSLDKAAEVGSYRPNAWGIYDMHGNVAELTANPGRIRGGSWCDSGRNCCSEIFIAVTPDACGGNLGFRVALVRN